MENLKKNNNISLGSWLIKSPSEILMLAADINYSNIYFTNGRKIMVATTMKTLEERLATNINFFRIHKHCMINLQYIKKIEADFTIEMQNNCQVIVSRRRKAAFENRLKIVNQ